MGDIISKIKDAEARAEKIIADAEFKAGEIEAAANIEIEKIRGDAEDAILRKTNFNKTAQYKGVQPFVIDKTELTIDKEQGTNIEVDKKKIEEVKKFIVAEFNKRYATIEGAS